MPPDSDEKKFVVAWVPSLQHAPTIALGAAFADEREAERCFEAYSERYYGGCLSSSEGYYPVRMYNKKLKVLAEDWKGGREDPEVWAPARKSTTVVPRGFYPRRASKKLDFRAGGLWPTRGPKTPSRARSRRRRRRSTTPRAGAKAGRPTSEGRVVT